MRIRPCLLAWLPTAIESPGFDPIPPIACGGRIAAGTTRDLNGESYGDWLFSFDQTGTRVTTGADGGPPGACFQGLAP